MPRRPDRRVYRDSPYLDEHARSQRDLATEPRGFTGLLNWFLSGFADETPEVVHATGVWFGRPPRVDAAGQPIEEIPPELVGGSQLGAPRQAEPFRQLLENSPRQTAGDGRDEHYVRPMRAALERLASRSGEDATFMARFLIQVAYARGDWRGVSDRWFPLTPYVGRAFAEQALRRLHSTYRPEPPIRYLPRPGWVDLSESQRAAVEASEKGVA